MIVNYTEAGWKIFTQRAHGLLAVQFAMHWKHAERPARWAETLMAIAEHDDAEIELRSDHLLTEEGGPLNYCMKKFDLRHCQTLADFALMKSRQVALLTSMHMCFLYEKEAASNATARRYLQNQKKLQLTWRKALGLTVKQCGAMYALLQWCDACSLLLCGNMLQPEERQLEISDGPDGTSYYMQKINEDALTISSWPFDVDRFTVTAEFRTIPQLRFNNAAAFRSAFLKAPVSDLVWTLQK